MSYSYHLTPICLFSTFGVSGRTMIKADATVREVSAASILAKVISQSEPWSGDGRT